MLRSTIAEDVGHPEEIEPILTSERRQLPVEEVHITIEKTSYEEIQEAISLLRREKLIFKTVNFSPSYAGGLLLALSIAGIVLSSMTFDKYGRRWGWQPEALSKYNNSPTYRRENSSDIFGVCGQAYPVKNLCHAGFNYGELRELDKQCRINEIDCNLSNLAWHCYRLADNICKFPESSGLKKPEWPILVVVFSCVGFLLAAGLLLCVNRIWDRESYIHDGSNQFQIHLKEIAEKFGLNELNNASSINEAISQLENKAEEVSRPAKRRAFLSAGLEENKDSLLHRFFKGVEKPGVNSSDVSQNPFATKEVKRMILDYAGLMPKTRLGR